jgi:hypothetical protein
MDRSAHGGYLTLVYDMHEDEDILSTPVNVP